MNPSDLESEWYGVAALGELDPDFPEGVEVQGQHVGLFLFGSAFQPKREIHMRQENFFAKLSRFVGLAVFICLAATATLSANTACAETIDFPIYARTIFFLPLWIADKQGFFKAEGIDIAFSSATQDEVAERLKTGKLGINLLVPEIVYADPSGSLRVVAGNAGRLPHFIIAQPQIKTIAQLRGANFGVISEHEGTTHIIPEIAKAAGLTRADYQMSAVGSATARWTLLKAGKIDAGLQPFPLSYEAEDAGFSNLGWAGKYEPDWQFTAIVVNREWAKVNAKTVTGFLRALRRGTEFMASNRDEAAAIAVAEIKTRPDYARRAIDDAIRLQIFDLTLNLNPAGMKRVFDLSPKALGVTVYDASKYVDSSYLRSSEMAR